MGTKTKFYYKRNISNEPYYIGWAVNRLPKQLWRSEIIFFHKFHFFLWWYRPNFNIYKFDGKWSVTCSTNIIKIDDEHGKQLYSSSPTLSIHHSQECYSLFTDSSSIYSVTWATANRNYQLRKSYIYRVKEKVKVAHTLYRSLLCIIFYEYIPCDWLPT